MILCLSVSNMFCEQVRSGEKGVQRNEKKEERDVGVAGQKHSGDEANKD